MILLFDIGNSRVKYATLREGEVTAGESAEYKSTESLSLLLDAIANIPQAIYIASVGRVDATKALSNACYKRWSVMPVTLTSNKSCAGVVNGYDIPATLGVDRWAAMIGGYSLVLGSVLVIDCGTACTADFVDSSGRHMGGAVIPGMQMMKRALQSDTAKIRVESTATDSSTWGTTTAGCVEFGVTQALIAFIESMRGKAISQLGSDISVILTGGDAPDIIKKLNFAVRYEKELVFLGMARMVAEEGEL